MGQESTPPETESELRPLMNHLAKALDRYFNEERTGKDRKWGFAVLIYPFDDKADRRADYISNTQREDVIASMRELVAREGLLQDAATPVL